MKKHGFTFLVMAAVVSILMLFSCNANVVNDSQKGGGDAGTEVSGGEASSRKLVKNATLNVETKEFDTLCDKVNEEIASLGGYVESSQISGNSYSHSSMRNAYIVARIPAASIDAFIAAVKDAGNVIREVTTVKDVTQNYMDIENRLKALRTEEQTLLSLLEKAENLDAVLTVQSRLTEVRTSIEDYESRLRLLENTIDYSTVTLYIDEVEHITVTEKVSVWKRIGSNLSEGFENVWLFLKELFVFLLSSIPYLLLIGALAGLALLTFKLTARIRKNKKTGNGGGNLMHPPQEK